MTNRFAYVASQVWPGLLESTEYAGRWIQVSGLRIVLSREDTWASQGRQECWPQESALSESPILNLPELTLPFGGSACGAVLG